MKHLDTKTLFDYAYDLLDEKRDEQVSKHIEECDQCFNEFQSIKEFHHLLFVDTENIPQKDHLSEEQQWSYLDGTLKQTSPEEFQNIQQHLFSCADCLSKIIEIRKGLKVMTEPGDIPADVLESDRKFIRELAHSEEIIIDVFQNKDIPQNITIAGGVPLKFEVSDRNIKIQSPLEVKVFKNSEKIRSLTAGNQWIFPNDAIQDIKSGNSIYKIKCAQHGDVIVFFFNTEQVVEQTDALRLAAKDSTKEKEIESRIKHEFINKAVLFRNYKGTFRYRDMISALFVIWKGEARARDLHGHDLSLIIDGKEIASLMIDQGSVIINFDELGISIKDYARIEKYIIRKAKIIIDEGSLLDE